MKNNKPNHRVALITICVAFLSCVILSVILCLLMSFYDGNSNPFEWAINNKFYFIIIWSIMTFATILATATLLPSYIKESEYKGDLYH